MPTETVYGLAADATNAVAVAQIYAAKQRPSFNPLIVHVADAAMIAAIAKPRPHLTALTARFWPGPLTVVLPLRPDAGIAAGVTAGLDTVAIRLPAHPLARALIASAGVPLAAPSANRSGRISPTTAQHVASGLGTDVALVLDGGPCQVGLESAIVDLSGDHPALLRAGGVTEEALCAVLPTLKIADQPTNTDPIAPRAPGQLLAHYAPIKPLRLNVTNPQTDETLLWFGHGPAPTDAIILSAEGDLTMAAARLFASLRAADTAPRARIAVAPIPDHDLGRAINDRLSRAARGR